MAILRDLLTNFDNSDSIIPTGIKELDEVIGGFRLGELHTVGEKGVNYDNSFLPNIIRNVGIYNKIPIAILSHHNMNDYLIRKLLATEGVGVHQFKKNYMSGKNTSWDRDWAQYVLQMEEAPIWIERTFDINMDEMVSRIERLKKENDIKLVVIYNLGWIFSKEATSVEKEHEIQKLAQTADELNIAIVITDNWNIRHSRRGYVKSPSLEDLRHGSCMERFSELVILLHCPGTYEHREKDEFGSTCNAEDVIVAKCHYPTVAGFRFYFDKNASPEFCDYNIATDVLQLPDYKLLATLNYFDNKH